MARWTKLLFVISVVLLILSYPACKLGEQKVYTEMAKYPPEFVAAHEFDFIFLKWVLPGMWLFSSGIILGVVSIVLGILQQNRRKRV